MRLQLLSETTDWKLDVVESYKEIAQQGARRSNELIYNKGDELEYVTYLAFLESTRETGLKFGITVRVELIVNNDTGDAWIDWIGRGPNRHNKIDPLPGYVNLRQLLAEIAKHHQNIKYFTGNRISGMRKKHPREFRLTTNKL